MLLVRQLLYKEKTLDDFDIDSDKSVFKLFFDLLLDMDGTRVTDGNVENNITNMFNDACFICNAVIQMKRPYLHYGYFRELASRFSPNDTADTTARALPSSPHSLYLPMTARRKRTARKKQRSVPV